LTGGSLCSPAARMSFATVDSTSAPSPGCRASISLRRGRASPSATDLRTEPAAASWNVDLGTGGVRRACRRRWWCGVGRGIWAPGGGANSFSTGGVLVRRGSGHRGVRRSSSSASVGGSGYWGRSGAVDRPRGRRRRRVSGAVPARRWMGAGWLQKSGTAGTREGAEHG
jgi:hypothetical protein